MTNERTDVTAVPPDGAGAPAAGDLRIIVGDPAGEAAVAACCRIHVASRRTAGDRRGGVNISDEAAGESVAVNISVSTAA